MPFGYVNIAIDTQLFCILTIAGHLPNLSYRVEPTRVQVGSQFQTLKEGLILVLFDFRHTKVDPINSMHHRCE